MRVTVRRAARLEGLIEAPGDKSISHRALLFAALGEGPCDVNHLAPGADVRSTAACLRALGVGMDLLDGGLRVHGVGLRGLRASSSTLDCGNSGTTMRLLAGVLAGASVGGVLDGDESLRGRPMRRVLDPLRAMGAKAAGTPNPRGDEVAPLRIEPGARLRGIAHALPIASAQVKSCVLLAGLWAEGETRVREPAPSRDHTERMLRALGVSLSQADDGAAVLQPPPRSWRMPQRFDVPGDPSSAAFALAAALRVPGGRIEVRGVNANPTRAGFVRALERMGAKLRIEPAEPRAGEEVAHLHVEAGGLKAITVAPEEIPSLIDEVPVLAVLATQAHGTTEIRGAGELRVKESDRLAQVARGLTAMGAEVEELPDGLRVHGPTPLHGAVIDAARDHRIAMAFAVAGLAAEGATEIDGAEWADISFPGFFDALAAWTGGAVSKSS